MNNILTSISLEKTVQSSLQLDAKKKARKKRTIQTIESAKQYIESFKGYRLLSTTYENNSTKLDILCPKEHLYKVTYGGFQSGTRCGQCAGKAKHRLSNVKRHIESFGYKLISTTYAGTHAKLDILCPNEHLYKATYDNFKTGTRCAECYNIAQRRTMINGEEWEPYGRNSHVDKPWKKAVKERDGQICQACFFPNKKLHAHHIESFARNPELQTDLNNGVTLCEPCHIEIHFRYGKMTATRADLEEFIRFKCS